MTRLTEQTVHPDEINKSHGHTVDNEGLLNNYAIEPEIYIEDGESPSALIDRVTIVDIFDSEEEAEKTVLEIEKKGLLVSHISIVAKNYQAPQSAMSWKTISAEGGLASFLTRRGISDQAIAKFVEAIDNGKFLIIEVGSDRDASQVQHVLEESGHSLQPVAIH